MKAFTQHHLILYLMAGDATCWCLAWMEKNHTNKLDPMPKRRSHLFEMMNNDVSSNLNIFGCCDAINFKFEWHTHTQTTLTPTTRPFLLRTPNWQLHESLSQTQVVIAGKTRTIITSHRWVKPRRPTGHPSTWSEQGCPLVAVPIGTHSKCFDVFLVVALLPKKCISFWCVFVYISDVNESLYKLPYGFKDLRRFYFTVEPKSLLQLYTLL